MGSVIAKYNLIWSGRPVNTNSLCNILGAGLATAVATRRSRGTIECGAGCSSELGSIYGDCMIELNIT